MVKPNLELKDEIALKNMVLQQTRDALLPRLISGKLAVDGLDIRFPLNSSPASQEMLSNP